jgi:hypothetical protein
MKLLIVIFLSISYAYSCSQTYLPAPECVGKEQNFILRFKILKSDLPAHFIIATDSSITIKVPAKEFMYSLYRAKEKQMWTEEYRHKNTEFIKSRKITSSATCRHTETDKKKKNEADFWDCAVRMDMCGNYEVPPTYEILGLWDTKHDEDARAAINAGKASYLGEETQYFLHQGKIKFLKFSVEWLKNSKFKKECVESHSL